MRTILFLGVVVSVGLFVTCDDGKDDVCAQADVITMAVMATACDGMIDCLPCDCWAAGQTVDGTECGAAPECDETAATECVANETACASTLYEMVETACASTL